MRKNIAMIIALFVAVFFAASCGPQREIIIDEMPAQQEQQLPKNNQEEKQSDQNQTDIDKNQGLNPKEIIDLAKLSGAKTQNSYWFSPVSLAKTDGL